MEFNSLKGEIEFKNLYFRYGNKSLVLKNINLKIKQDERIALVLENSLGKITLVKF